MLGYNGDVTWQSQGGKMHIEIPQLSVDDLPCRYAYTFKLSGIE